MRWFELTLRDNEEHTFSNRFRKFIDLLYANYEEEIYVAYTDSCES